MSQRCGKCPACLRVEQVKQLGLLALGHADVRRANSGGEYSVGEDVRLIWNRTLEENPCEEASSAS